MKIMIQGQDYTAALDASRPLTIERKLNEPSMCELWLSIPSNGTLPSPARYETLAVTGDNGTTYFTGYIAVSPLIEYAGVGLEGPRYRTGIQAVSDELILDGLLMPPSAGSSGETAGSLIASLVTHSGSAALSTAGLTLNTCVSNFVPEPGTNWSQRAGQVASMTRAAYRALNGALALTSIQAQVHPLNETDGSLTLANLAFTASVKRALANDVTVCGEDEPVAYVTEYFLGDGVTTTFNLAADPYLLSSSKSRIINELFNEPQINQTVWSASGGPGYLALGPAGLAMNGGNGIDGQTALTWIDAVEMGGTLLLEASGVVLSPGSTGVVAGFFSGGAAQANCIAGFQVTAQQGTGAVTLQPLIQGCASGTTFSVNSQDSYTLRMRVRCPELERSRAICYAFGDGGPISAGGQGVPAPCSIQMEVQQFVNGVGATPVTVYSGSLANLPGACQVVGASSINLIGSMRGLDLNNLGSVWVVSTPPGGSPYTRRIGTTAQQAECHIERSGKLVFYTGYVPVAGEQIAASYRTIGRAVGRAVNSASQQALAQAGSPSVAAWIGSVTSPPARSSADCRNAALVMEQAAASVSALWSGTYIGNNSSFGSDVWPGDALQLNAPSANLNAQVVIRTVKMSYAASYPDLVTYDIAFANDWADDLAIKTSTRVPEDTWLPAPVAPTVLSNLNGLTVTALSGSTVTVNTGVAAPSGGGFEIRLRDFTFMPGEDPTLVMRGSQQTLTFSRVSAADRFYIRMYDGSTPPNYSEFSAALFINLPLSSNQ
ncbi:MAG TPA: hypothetical protein VME23_11420 [Terracidiphilus sp.]|nr:hypothetical protein [Terracidiphilus sp.]